MRGPVRIGLLGRGTVGGASRELLGASAPTWSGGDRAGGPSRRRAHAAAGRLRPDPRRQDVVVELIGGTDPARDYVLAALRAGRHVVTANKQLIAQHGDELFEAAREGGAQLRFEAAVAGVIPVIRVIQESLAAIEIEQVFGIVNGTTNFILTEMAAPAPPTSDALAQAQELGYAEADPTEDVNGADAAAKMAILARLAFDTAGQPRATSPTRGSSEIQPDDLAYAKELGLSLKLLGVAERRDGGSACASSPASSTAAIRWPRSRAPSTRSWSRRPAITEITMSGPGAGGLETASAVLGDVVSILSGGAPRARARRGSTIVARHRSAFYLHLEVADRPGVLAQVADVLGATRSRSEASSSGAWATTRAW